MLERGGPGSACPLPRSRSRLQLPQTSDAGGGLRVTLSGAAPRTRGCPPVHGEGERESQYENARLLGQKKPACAEQVRCHRSTCASIKICGAGQAPLAHQRRRRHRGWKRVCVERTTGAARGVRSHAQRAGRARQPPQHLPPPRPPQGSPTDGGWVMHCQSSRARPRNRSATIFGGCAPARQRARARATGVVAVY